MTNVFVKIYIYEHIIKFNYHIFIQILSSFSLTLEMNSVYEIGRVDYKVLLLKKEGSGGLEPPALYPEFRLHNYWFQCLIVWSLETVLPARATPTTTLMIPFIIVVKF